jgi:hypothetical protein
MAFLLYHTAKLANGETRYRQIEKDIPLAGNGLIYTTCHKFLSDKDVGWTITEKDMLTTGCYNPDEHALVIDISPNRRGSINLFEIKLICGFSYSDWTPLMLTFEQLFSEQHDPEEDAEKIKQQFDDGECERLTVREFLYLRGGHGEGTWNWGGNSFTTAALLWGDAWNYFHECIA